MTANGQTVATSPGDQIRERLDDPAVAEALNTLLDHAELLAVLVSGLDGFIRRGDTISNSLSSALTELKGAPLGSAVPGAAALKGVDIQALAASLAALSATLVAATPVLSALGEAVVDAKAAATVAPPKGLFGLWKVTKDPDVGRGMNFMIQVARSFGRRVGR
ncbi:hypothetical protein CRM90_10660 [Mycobacterium sp. ENV421]|uniref:DUF1641 domain-containing protein n=1 Tax=Mycobacterium sp. ENV421 TaxID=1213407 RepID=UPI000C9AFC0B|nr:DUF1641 domain-containing protein [Mycobacterium sp. ENV421]PND57913.1 hypothetical protein CRM90_10660 [Mycobacterium sp. ENV421]